MRQDRASQDVAPEGLFEEIKATANGMLPVAVYARIHETAREWASGSLVEVGTAHGAATIALALGAQTGGRPFHIFTVDPFGGKYSSRAAYGSVEQNIAIVQRHFEHFGVSDDITIVAGSVETLLESHDIDGVTTLMIDADGRIDRDLALLYRRLTDDCRIIVDDIDGQTYLSNLNGHRMLDQKHRIGQLLTQAFLDAGLLVAEDQLSSTGFYAKGSGDPEVIGVVALPAYRELVFANLDGAVRADPPAWRAWVRDNVPFARDIYRRFGSWRHSDGT
jgi:predicted O-methyltransferase YrrM